MVRITFRKNAGFTLIELVIAVALLAILATAAVIAFQNIHEKAQSANVRATLKRVRSSILIQKANNQLNNSAQDAFGNERVNFWPTYEEVRRATCPGLVSDSILDTLMPPNPFIADPKSPPFSNITGCESKTITGITAANPCQFGIPDNVANPASNLVVCAPVATGTECPATNCLAGWAYNPSTGEFWANSCSACGYGEQLDW